MSVNISPTLCLWLAEDAFRLKDGAMTRLLYFAVLILAHACAMSWARCDSSRRSQAVRVPECLTRRAGHGRGNLMSAVLLASLNWLPSYRHASLNSSTGRPCGGAWYSHSSSG